MKNSRIIGYGLGSLGKDFALGVIGSYLLVFYTDVFGISAAAAGTILFVARIWDAINDPMMGAIADRTNSKWGRFRPYVLIAPIPLAVFSALTFLTPDLSYTGKVIYAGVTYIITGMLFTCYDVPLWGMVPSLTKDLNIRNKLITSARIFTTIAMLLSSVLALPIINSLGGGSEVANLKKGYPLFMAIVGVVSVIFAWITFFCTKEEYYDPTNKKTGNIFKDFSSVFNKPLAIVLATMAVQAICMIIPSTVGVYYMMYYIKRPELIPVYMLISMGLGVVASPLVPILLKKINAKKLTVIAFAMNAICSTLAYFVGGTNLTLLFILYGIIGLGTGIPMITITTLLAQTSDYMAEKSGKRSDGVVFSLNSFSIKLGSALAGIIVSFILATTGYVPNSFEQSSAALSGINLSRTLIPTVIYIIGAVVLNQYTLPKLEKQSKVTKGESISN